MPNKKKKKKVVPYHQNTQAFKEVTNIRHPRIGEYAFGFINSFVTLQFCPCLEDERRQVLYAEAEAKKEPTNAIVSALEAAKVAKKVSEQQSLIAFTAKEAKDNAEAVGASFESLFSKVNQLTGQLYEMRIRMKNLMGLMEGGSVPALSDIQEALKTEQKVRLTRHSKRIICRCTFMIKWMHQDPDNSLVMKLSREKCYDPSSCCCLLELYEKSELSQ